MSEWEKVTDDEGNVYYYNSVTQETSWTAPEEGSDQASEEWQEFETDEGVKYYYNSTTGETTWEKPDTKEVQVTELDEKLAQKPVELDIVEETEKEKEETVENQFEMLLKQHNVDSTWSFQDVMAKLINNPIYWKVSSSLERKRIYDEFLAAETSKDVNNKTNALHKFKVNFVQVLETYTAKGVMNHRTRWSSVKSRLVKDDNPTFKHTILSDGEVYVVFKEYQDQLRKTHQDEVALQREQALVELEAYITKINTALAEQSGDWDSLYGNLLKDNRFKANKRFNYLHKADILSIYSEKILGKKIEELEGDVTQKEKSNYRSDRKARDNFKRLLAELPWNDILTDGEFDFKTVLPFLEDEDAFIELCGRNGSNAVELLLDVVSEKQQLLKVKADLVESVISNINDDKTIEEQFLRDIGSFISNLNAIEDERLASIKGLDEGELGNVQSLLIKSFDNKNTKKIESVGHELSASRKKLVSWVGENFKTCVAFKLVESQTEEDTGLNTVLVDSKSSTKYSLLTTNASAFDKSNIPQLSSFISQLDKLNDLTPVPIALETAVKQVIEEALKVANESEKTAKRPADIEESDRKRQKPSNRLPLNY